MAKAKIKKVSKVRSEPQPESVPEKLFSARVQTQKLAIATPDDAEVFRKFLQQYESDVVVRQGEQWFYVRTRAFVEEATKDAIAEAAAGGEQERSGEAEVRPDSSGAAA